MKIEFILLSICQVFGVFPINVKGTRYTISRIYLASSFLLLLYLASAMAYLFTRLQHDSNKQSYCGVLLKFGFLMFLMKISASVIAIITNIAYRHKNVKFCNKLMTLISQHQYTNWPTFKISGTFHLVVIIVIGFFFLQAILTFVALSILSRENIDWYIMYIAFIECPVFFDSIVFCGLCTVMSNCHQRVKGQLENIYKKYCTEKFDSNTENNDRKINSNLTTVSTITRKKIITDMSILTKKLEELRHNNFELFEMHLFFLFSRQFQFILSLSEILLEIITTAYALLSTITENSDMGTLCYDKMVVAILSKLMRLSMLCYYNGKVFQEGQDTKYILEKIRPLSSDRQFVISTNAFVSQIKRRKPYKVCGLSTLDMSFPIKILEYTINYVLVLVQFFGFQE